MKNISRLELENIYGKISPFEFKNKLIELATLSNRKSTRTLLDAGRGNPNWIASTPREAFFTFGQFAITESRYTWDDGDLTGMPKKTGIYKRFCTYVENNKFMPGIDTLKAIIDYGIEELNFDKDEFLHELTDAIIGDNYPFPDRMLIHIEKIVKEYLKREMKYDVEKGGEFNVFAVEGATAAMCYIFDSLIANNLLLKGDKIAIMTPVFTPYLEIPHLPRYEFEVVYINADEIDENDEHTWQCSNKELEKLSNPDIKALFVVNPSNPPSVAISQKSISKIVDIVKTKNKDLMIISDDVYGTFIHGFRSLMADLPYNTIGVYSYSKYFGVTGWRLGTIALHENNVFDITKFKISANVNNKIRIVHLSDLHSKEFGKDNKRLKNIILKQKPNIVVTTGDMIDSNLRKMDEIINFLAELNKEVYVVYIPGNNEMRTEKINEILYKINLNEVIVLDNKIKEININNNKIFILGLVENRIDEGESFYEKANSRYFYNKSNLLFNELESKNGIKIVLSHYPENFAAIGEESYNKYNFNIMFSGHAHGGQFILPFIGGLFAPGQGILPKYYRGIHGEKNKLIISRGLGNSGFPLRLFNRPEVIVVDIYNEKII